MADCCICLTTDQNYFLPSLVTAIQARANASPDLADVAIYCSDVHEKDVDELARICELERISFSPIEPESIEGTKTAFARLFLDRLVPPQYTQLLYLDSDIQVVGCLDPLITAKLESGQFLAAADPISFEIDHADRPTWMAEYFDIRQYFNNGVLRMDRAGWAEIGRKAHEVCRTLPAERSSFWDQDSLNVVGRAGARLPMSLKWNFPIFMRNCRVEEQIQPVIYHYMSRPKPWNGNFAPWSRAETLPYKEVMKKYPRIPAPNHNFTPGLVLKYGLQQTFKRMHETAVWGLTARRQRILKYEAAVVI